MNLSKSILIIICSIFFLNFLSVNTQNPNLKHTNCSNKSNFTKNSLYESNLKIILSKLSVTASSINPPKFEKITSGVKPDIVYGLYLCQGDILDPKDCTNCIINATKSIIEACNVQKTAITWYESCTLRYSNVNFIGKMETSPWVFSSSEEESIEKSKVGSFELIKMLIDKVNQSSEHYVAEKFDGGKSYGMVQCTRDIRANDCVICLKNLVKKGLEESKNKVWWQMYAPSCNLRYNSNYVTDPPQNPPPNPPPDTPQNPPPDTPQNPPPGPGEKPNYKIILAAVAAAIATLAIVFFVVYCCIFSSTKVSDVPKEEKKDELGLDDIESDESKQQMRCISLLTIQTATNGFSDDNKLGQGGFGPVYKGELPDGEEIAIKRLSEKSNQGFLEFKNEVNLISKLQHRNLVRLVGYCFEEDEQILVYEYMSNTSLDAYIFDPIKSKELDWGKRMKIIHGIIRGLQYLHKDSRPKIIHRDLKSSNILLDHEMNPKISDFGTARIFGCHQMEADTDRIVGTIGYMSPEYAQNGKISEKSDIYSFGVLLLEIISGKKATQLVSYNDQQFNLIDYAWESWCETKGLNMINDEELMLSNSFSSEEVMKCVNIALLCLQFIPEERPSISRIGYMMRDNSELLCPKRPSFVLRNLDCDQLTMSDKMDSINEVTQTIMEPRS